MNYTIFMEKANEAVKAMSAAEKDAWILRQAMKQDENTRTSFLQSLSGKKDEAEMTFEAAMKCCRKISAMEIHFTCEGHEDYDAGYWSDEWVYEYADPYHVGKELDKLLNYFACLIDQQDYKKAIRLADYVSSIEFNALDESGGDVYEMSLEELFENRLVNFSEDRYSKLLLKGIFNVEASQKQYCSLMERLKENIFKQTKVEDILSICQLDLAGIHDFLEGFILFLGPGNGDREYELIAEASILKGGTGELVKTTLQYGKNYPALFIKCCEVLLDQEHDNEQCIRIAQAAVDQLAVNIRYRGRAAALGARASENIGKRDSEGYFWKEAFWSDSNVGNILHMLICNYESPDLKILVDQARIHISNLPEKTYYALEAERQYASNVLEAGGKKIFGIFLGDIKDSMSYCTSCKSYLGWSSEIQGIIVPLILGSVSGQKTMTRAIRAMLDRIGQRYTVKMDTDELWPLLVLWRDKCFEVDETACFDWLESQIEKRTEAVVGGGHRHSYEKAAELIVVLDEIYTAKGLREKGVTMESYRRLHSRKSAFRQELERLKVNR